MTLVEAIAEVERLGYNAINFQEYTFVPTVEAPDHDHACFLKTMRHYYAFLPSFPDRLNVWKRQEVRSTSRRAAAIGSTSPDCGSSLARSRCATTST